MNPGFLPAFGGYSPYASSFLPGGFSQFTYTGVPGFTGGFAYPPGSQMTQLMDGLNNQVAAATQGPYGGSIVDWAQGLLAGQQAGMQQAPPVPPAAPQQGASTGFELIGLLLGILMAAASKKVKAKQEQGDKDSSGESE